MIILKSQIKSDKLNLNKEMENNMSLKKINKSLEKITKGHSVSVNIGKEGHEVAEPAVPHQASSPVPTSKIASGPMAHPSEVAAAAPSPKHDTSKSLKAGSKHLGKMLAGVKKH